MFLVWFFDCFYIYQVFEISWMINRKNFTSATKFLFLIGLISAKYLQSTKFKVKCHRCFINLEFCESVTKKWAEYLQEHIFKNIQKYIRIYARILKPKQLNFFAILILFMIVPLLVYFSNLILEFFVDLLEFSLSVF